MPTIHNPTNFKPEDYEVFGYYDNKPPECVYGDQPGDWQRRFNHWKEELSFAFGDIRKAHKCVHCGTGNVRYVVSCVHVPTGEKVCFGDVCVNRLGFKNQAAFKAAAIRKAAAHEAARIAVALTVQRICENDAELNAAVTSVSGNNPAHERNNFVRDIVSKLFKYGNISPRQRECLINSVNKDIDTAANPPPPAPVPTAPAPEGKATVEGTCVYVKENDGFGYNSAPAYKMLIVLDTNAKVWVSVPKSINHEEVKQKRVKITATWVRKQGDEFFAFGSRPRGEVIDAAQPELVTV